MIKVIAACGSGMGSSMMMKMKLEKVFKSLGIQASVTHTNAGEAKATAAQYHMIVCSEVLKDMFTSAAESGIEVIPLKNILDEKEITEKLKTIDFDRMQKRYNT